MQASFSDLEYASKKKQTRRERFLAEMTLDPEFAVDTHLPAVDARRSATVVTDCRCSGYVAGGEQ